MRKNIASVIDAWHAGEAHMEKTCRTDGTSIWSYDLKIATRSPNGVVTILDRDAARMPNGEPSATTRSQVDAVRAAMKAELVVVAQEV